MARGYGAVMDILESYQQEALHYQSKTPWLAQLQAQAWADFAYQGFPGRHDEEWKYTRVDALIKQPFHRPHHDTALNGVVDSPFAQNISIQNGSITGIKSLQPLLPKGVVIVPLNTALIDYSELIKPYLGQILKQEHGFHFLNTTMIDCGLMIYIPAGVHIEEPLVLTHYQNIANQAVYLRHLIIAEAGSSATIIEDYQGAENEVYLTNTVTEIMVGEKATLVHCTLQRESRKAYHLGHISVKQQAQSEFKNHSFSVGGKLVRSDLSVYLENEKAYCLMNGVYAPTEGQHVDHHTTVHHLVPHCDSEQNYKGILKGQSRAVFNGKVCVAAGAQQTQAKQQNKNLLLSAQAEIDTKPQLEIFADDVQCTHGATVGQLDEEALFYLATRGIDRVEAAQFLIHAFAKENLQLIPHPQLAHLMGQLLINQLG